MPQVRKTGTAWELCLDDYAYTRGLDHAGWAWEFLRRNEDYQRDDFRTSTAQVIRYRSNMPAVQSCCACGDAFLPQRGGVYTALPTPNKSAPDAYVFWLTDHAQNSVNCTLRVANDNDLGALSLVSTFAGQRRVLVTPHDEHVVITCNQVSAHMVVRNSTFLIGESVVTFEVRGLEEPEQPNRMAIRTLRAMRSNQCAQFRQSKTRYRSKYFDYLVALDGHLAGRSYRDIAEVLYGSVRIGPYWTNDSRGWPSNQKSDALLNADSRS